MPGQASRPSIPIPPELKAVIENVQDVLKPAEIWLFGSRARGDHRPDSDWDVLAVLPDGASAETTNPLLTWTLSSNAPVPTTILSTTRGELDAIWGLPNTLGHDLSRDGVRLLVG